MARRNAGHPVAHILHGRRIWLRPILTEERLTSPGWPALRRAMTSRVVIGIPMSALRAAQFLEERAHLVARLFPPHHAAVRHPVELDDAARTVERLESVPGVGRVLEDEERAFIGRHFGDDVVEIVRRTQQTQPPGRALPLAVHIDENGDQLALAVGVDLAVARR